jgi:antirestriction protein ArdC
MTRKTTTKTAEQRKADAQALLNTLGEQVAALATSDDWQQYLDFQIRFARSFHRYSLNNLLLIAAQRDNATQVAGFRRWQELGRQVRKGEKGIKIIGFAQRKITETDAATGEDVEKKIPYFPTRTVFDIAQTDVIEGHPNPYIPAPLPEAGTVEGDETLAAHVFDAVADHMRAQGWTVDRQPIQGSVNGYTSTDGRIVIDSTLTPAHAAKTMLHEAAHVTLGHVERADEYRAHRGTMETEAESVAYVLAGMAGLDASGYSVHYVTGWANGDSKVLEATASRVLDAVQALAPAVLGEEEEVAEAA